MASPTMDEILFGAATEEAERPPEKRPPRTRAKSAPVQKVVEEPARIAPVVEIAPVRNLRGFLRVTNELMDEILPSLPPGEQVVLLRLYRLTRGFQADTVTVSKATLASRCHVKETALRGHLKMLERKGLIKRLGEDISNPNKSARGMTIKIMVPGVEGARNPQGSEIRTRAENAPNKEELKETLKSEVRCARCKDMGGFIYMEDRTVKRCTHDG